jgi:hypothetical protein
VVLHASRDQAIELPDGRRLPVKAAERLEASDAQGGQLAFVALDDDFSARYVPRLVELGYRVVDKSNTYRMDPRVPLVVAGVNCDLLTSEVRLAANPSIAAGVSRAPRSAPTSRSAAPAWARSTSFSPRPAGPTQSPIASGRGSTLPVTSATPFRTAARPTKAASPRRSAS